MTGWDQIHPRQSHGLMNFAPSRGANRIQRVQIVEPLQPRGGLHVLAHSSAVGDFDQNARQMLTSYSLTVKLD